MSPLEYFRLWMLRPLYLEADGSPGILTRLEAKVDQLLGGSSAPGEATELHINVLSVEEQE